MKAAKPRRRGKPPKAGKQPRQGRISSVLAGSFKLAASQSAQQAVARQEQLHALGELAAGVAHDVSNTLAAIALRLSALKRDEVCMDAQGQNIEAISRILQEGAEMVRKLQRLGQRDEHRPPEWVDVAATIRSAVEMAQSGLRYRALNDGIDIRIEVVLPQLPLIRGWGDELRRVFVNLLLNARDALPGGGRIVVKAHTEARRMVVTVADDGVGIQQAALPRLFEPFFTTKGIAGSGMGLATAERVMRMMGGEITAANGATGGAVFRLTFPVPRAIKAATAATQQSATTDATLPPPD